MRASDAIVAGRSAFGLAGAVDLDDVERLPQVRTTARASVSLVFTGRTGDGRRVGPVDLFPILPADRRFGTVLERAHITEGRAADPRALDEATVSFVLAERLDLHPGSTIRLQFVRASSFPTAAATLLSNFGARLAGAPGSMSSAIDELADGPDVTFRIVGVEASPAEFPPVGPDLAPPMRLTPAFSERYGDELVVSPLLYVGLRAPDQLDAFSKGIERLAAGAPAGFVQNRSLQTPKVERAIQVQATAMRIVALLVLLALVLVVGQALVRLAYVEADDDRVLRARSECDVTSSARSSSPRGRGDRRGRRAPRSRGRGPHVPAHAGRPRTRRRARSRLRRRRAPPGARRPGGLRRDRRAPPLRGLAGARRRVPPRCRATPVRRRPRARSAERVAERRHRRTVRARSGPGRLGDPGVDDGARGHADDRVARRTLVVPGEPPAHARHPAPLRVELEREDGRAGAARPQPRRCCRRSPTTRWSGASRPGRSRRPSWGSSGSTSWGWSNGAAGWHRRWSRAGSTRSRRRGAPRHPEPRTRRPPHRRHRGPPARQHRRRAPDRRARALPRVRRRRRSRQRCVRDLRRSPAHAPGSPPQRVPRAVPGPAPTPRRRRSTSAARSIRSRRARRASPARSRRSRT